jgi:hypothetical protein
MSQAALLQVGRGVAHDSLSEGVGKGSHPGTGAGVSVTDGSPSGGTVAWAGDAMWPSHAAEVYSILLNLLSNSDSGWLAGNLN